MHPGASRKEDDSSGKDKSKKRRTWNGDLYTEGGREGASFSNTFRLILSFSTRKFFFGYTLDCIV